MDKIGLYKSFDACFYKDDICDVPTFTRGIGTANARIVLSKALGAGFAGAQQSLAGVKPASFSAPKAMPQASAAPKAPPVAPAMQSPAPSVPGIAKSLRLTQSVLELLGLEKGVEAIPFFQPRKEINNSPIALNFSDSAKRIMGNASAAVSKAKAKTDKANRIKSSYVDDYIPNPNKPMGIPQSKPKFEKSDMAFAQNIFDVYGLAKDESSLEFAKLPATKTKAPLRVDSEPPMTPGDEDTYRNAEKSMGDLTPTLLDLYDMSKADEPDYYRNVGGQTAIARGNEAIIKSPAGQISTSSPTGTNPIARSSLARTGVQGPPQKYKAAFGTRPPKIGTTEGIKGKPVPNVKEMYRWPEGAWKPKAGIEQRIPQSPQQIRVDPKTGFVTAKSQKFSPSLFDLYDMRKAKNDYWNVPDNSNLPTGFYSDKDPHLMETITEQPAPSRTEAGYMKEFGTPAGPPEQKIDYSKPNKPDLYYKWPGIQEKRGQYGAYNPPDRYGPTAEWQDQAGYKERGQRSEIVPLQGGKAKDAKDAVSKRGSAFGGYIKSVADIASHPGALIKPKSQPSIPSIASPVPKPPKASAYKSVKTPTGPA